MTMTPIATYRVNGRLRLVVFDSDGAYIRNHRGPMSLHVDSWHSLYLDDCGNSLRLFAPCTAGSVSGCTTHKRSKAGAFGPIGFAWRRLPAGVSHA